MKNIDWGIIKSIANLVVLFFLGLSIVVGCATKLVKGSPELWPTVFYVFGVVVGLYILVSTLYVAYSFYIILKKDSNEEDYD